MEDANALQRALEKEVVYLESIKKSYAGGKAPVCKQILENIAQGRKSRNETGKYFIA